MARFLDETKEFPFLHNIQIGYEAHSKYYPIGAKVKVEVKVPLRLTDRQTFCLGVQGS
jgi:muramoyltetrapeptide carboxypeptidase LdcA involved in peptidoglycan recycling